MLEVTDGFHVTNYYYPDVPNCTAEALFMRIKDDIKDKFFKNAEIKVLPQLSVIIVISHVPQLCFKQLLATPSIHCTFYHF